MTFADVHPRVRRLSLLSDAKLATLWDAAGAAIESIGGDLAELGVRRGGVGLLLARRCPSRTVHLYDTFTGIPWDGFDDRVDRHRPGEFATPLDEVKRNLADCPNVAFHPGLFPGTAKEGRYALVHLDADLYASTLAGLKWFWPRLNTGGAIVLDDWKWHFCPGVEKAVEEFFAGADGYEFEQHAEHQLTVRKKR